jgi:hypothetical protein
MTHRLLLTAALMTLPACQSLADGAKKTFSRSNSCPVDRVEVRERPDLLPSSFQSQGTPPADIAADPERRKLWLQQREKMATAFDGTLTIVEAHGCGRDTFYGCRRVRKQMRRVACSAEGPAPTGVSHW